jgi:hypothetical protein
MLDILAKWSDQSSHSMGRVPVSGPCSSNLKRVAIPVIEKLPLLLQYALLLITIIVKLIPISL